MIAPLRLHIKLLPGPKSTPPRREKSKRVQEQYSAGAKGGHGKSGPTFIMLPCGIVSKPDCKTDPPTFTQRPNGAEKRRHSGRKKTRVELSLKSENNCCFHLSACAAMMVFVAKHIQTVYNNQNRDFIAAGVLPIRFMPGDRPEMSTLI